MSSSKNQYLTLSETFDADKLSFIINNIAIFKDKMRWQDRYDLNDPFVIIKKYLNRSRNGNVKVDYKQKRGRGRYCAMGSMSLQTIPREIRQTICKEFYYDIDMVNAHPVILSYLCKTLNVKCPALNEYNLNREQLIQDAIQLSAENAKEGKVADRERIKKVYLSLTNGGIMDYTSLGKIHTKHMIKYKKEMTKLHKFFAGNYPAEFELSVKKRQKSGKDSNHEAGFMNTLMCDMENNILQKMYQFFGCPENAVLCFDGIMLKKGLEYDIDGCIKFIEKNYPKLNLNIKMKEMTEDWDMTEYDMPKYEYFSLEYYTDFRNLVKHKEIYIEWVEEWSNNCINLIENNGHQHFITKKKEVIVFSDKTTEIRDEWKPIKEEDIYKNLRVKCDVINTFRDYDFCQKYKALTPKEKKELDIPREELDRLTKQFTFGTLGTTNVRLGEGYLTYLMENRNINSYNSVDFFPYIKERGIPPLHDTFNIFTEFPLDKLSDDFDTSDRNFEDSGIYNHMKTDFFNGDIAELNHFLDHMADIIQDPAEIKGTSHLFYSKQGCGKGLLFKFMSRMLGIANVVSISNTDLYFDSNFNGDMGNKLLKVFEEVSEKGSAFKNHNRLKAEQTSETERIEPKGIDPYYNRHCARFWYFTNNENSLYIENDDRRHTLHRISDAHSQNIEYFAPMWDEIKDKGFLKNAFNYLKNRKYDIKNVIQAYTTQYKKEQKDNNLSKGIKFLLEYVGDNFNTIEDKTMKITSNEIKGQYKEFCENQGCKYQMTSFNTQIRKIGIEAPKQLKIKGEDGISVKKFCYSINTYKLQEEMRRFLRDDNFILKVLDNQILEDADEGDVIGY